MTPAVELVARLRARGVTLEPDGPTLVVRPATAVRPDEIDALRKLKAEVLALLAPHPHPPETRPPAPALSVPDLIAAYQETLGRLYSFNIPGVHADVAEIRRLLDVQARECNELGPAFAEAVGRQAARQWAARAQRCPWCGTGRVFHDPETGDAIALDIAAIVALTAGPEVAEAPQGPGTRAAGPMAFACASCGEATRHRYDDTPLCERCAADAWGEA